MVRRGVVAAAAIGIGTLAICGLGVVRTVGRLRAADVDVSYALSMVPLDRHVDNAIAVVTDPALPSLLVLLGCGLLVSRWVRSAVATRSTPDRGITVEGRMPPAMLSLVAILAALSLAWVGLTAPWPWLAPIAMVACAVLFLDARLRERSRERSCGRATRWSQLRVGLLAAATLLAAALDTFSKADPPPYAEVRGRAGAATGGPLIAKTQSTILVGDGGGLALHHEIPVSQAVRVRLSAQEPVRERSVVEIVGLK
jgi:hypothetical protein